MNQLIAQLGHFLRFLDLSLRQHAVFAGRADEVSERPHTLLLQRRRGKKLAKLLLQGDRRRDDRGAILTFLQKTAGFLDGVRRKPFRQLLKPAIDFGKEWFSADLVRFGPYEALDLAHVVRQVGV